MQRLKITFVNALTLLILAGSLLLMTCTVAAFSVTCMYMCPHVRVCVRMYVCPHVHMCVRICVRMYVFMSAFTYVCPHVRMCVRIYICVNACTYVCTHVRTYVCTHVRMCVCTVIWYENYQQSFLKSLTGAHGLKPNITEVIVGNSNDITIVVSNMPTQTTRFNVYVFLKKEVGDDVRITNKSVSFRRGRGRLYPVYLEPFIVHSVKIHQWFSGFGRESPDGSNAFEFTSNAKREFVYIEMHSVHM